MAIELARQHGVDQEKAGEAALLHDLAKYFKSQQLLEMAQQEGLSLDPVDLANPHLLHADVGAIVAREKFGVQDQEILAAIANLGYLLENHRLIHPRALLTRNWFMQKAIG